MFILQTFSSLTVFKLFQVSNLIYFTYAYVSFGIQLNILGVRLLSFTFLFSIACPQQTVMNNYEMPNLKNQKHYILYQLYENCCL